jgi:aminoglycoside phosphotransferase (APT) family kinase protein
VSATETAATSFESRIRAYLRDRMDRPDLALSAVEQISTGWSHETWLFDGTWSDGSGSHRQGFCLRLDPGKGLLREMSDLAVQYRVLRSLENQPVPTPRPLLLEEDPVPLGGPFLVMEKVPGSCPSPWSRAGRRFYQDAAARGVLPGSFTDTLAGLHLLNWREAGLDFLGVPGPGQGFALGEVARWRRLIDASGLEPHPVLIDLMGWLDTNAPVTERLVLVHGAYRTGNLLIEDDRVAAILDWETEVIGDPMYDVAYVLSELNREGTDLLSNLVERDDFFRRYETSTDIEIDLELCRYYHLLYAMRSAAFWMSASGLYASGANPDLRLARTAWSIPVVLDQAARALGY